MNHFRKYIHKANNRWVVQKTINGKLKAYKSFTKLNDAIQYRDQLIQNNWEEPPEETENRKKKEYYKHIHTNQRKRKYVILNNKSKYLGTVNTIEEALYYRDLYSDCPTKVPRPSEVDLKTDNPYLIGGLRYPLPERLQKQDNYTDYGKGHITQRSVSSYRVSHNSTNYCTCRTYEQADYVRKELNKCDWDKNQIPRILADYPRYYTWLLLFYQYISKIKVDGEWNGKWKLVIPRDYTEEGKLEYLTYSNIEDALYERDILKENGWDYETLVYTIDDTKNPYYEMELPPYPQRKIRNIQERKTFQKELEQMRDLILDGVQFQSEAAEIMGVTTMSLRNWLNNYNIKWNDFKAIVESGEDIWNVLELKERYFTPDLSPSKPSNYTGYVHKTQSKRSPYCVARKGEYYGSYSDKKTAKKVVKELEKVNWDKKQLRKIQDKLGHKQFLNSKRWVYEVNNGKSWMIRKKNKDRKMINYGHYKDKKIAEKVRDLLVENNWDKTRLDEFRRIAENGG